MRKIAIGLAVLAVLGVGGYFGFTTFVQYRARADVEAVFAALRRDGARARYGDVSFQVSGRVLTVTEIEIAAPDGAAEMKAGRLVASGVTSPAGGMVSARAIDISGLLVTTRGAATGGASVSYAMPQMHVDNYAGPAAILKVPAGNGASEALRATLAHFAALRIDGVSIPRIEAHIAPAPAGAPGLPATQTADISYANVAIAGIQDGRVARASMDRIAFDTRLDTGTGKPEQVSGEIGSLVASGIDTAPIRAMTDTEPKGNDYQAVYGKVTARGYRLTQSGGAQVSVGTLTMERMGLNPLSLSFERLEALSAMAQRPQPLAPEDSARLLTTVADALDGISIGAVSLADITVADAGETAKIAAIRLEGMAGGRLETFGIEGLDATTRDNKPMAIKRLAVRGFSLDTTMRLSAETLRQDGKPSLDAAFGAFKMLDGIEMEGVSMPAETSGAPIGVQRFAVSWSDIAGALPTRFSLQVEKLSGPISQEDGGPFADLLAAGLTQATLNSELALAYDAATGTLTLAPLQAELEQAAALRVDGRLDNLAKSAFEDPAGAFLALHEATPGPVTLTLTDLGLTQMMLKAQAEAAQVEPEDLRAELISGIEQAAEGASASLPDAPAIGAALAAFLKAPGTLTVTLTPKGKIPVYDLVSAGDVMGLLDAFTVKVTASR